MYFTKVNRIQHTLHDFHHQNIHQNKGISYHEDQNPHIDEHLRCKLGNVYRQCHHMLNYTK